MMPMYFRMLPGNISDVSLIPNLLKDVDFLNMEKLKLVLDRGFYSENNVNAMMKYHHKFLIGAKLNLKFIAQKLNEIRGEEFITWTNYHDDVGLYVRSFTMEWLYKEDQPRSGRHVEEKRRIYVHFYYNDQRHTDDRIAFNRKLSKLHDAIQSNPQKLPNEQLCKKYFDWKTTPKRGLTITPKNEAIEEAQKNFGYFALMSNDIKDPIEAIKIYRTKDLIEKSFNNLKDRLDMRRMSVSSEESFTGKLFVQFVALKLSSYIKKQMDANELFKNYSIPTLLDELDIIQYFQQPGKAHHLSEITSKQKKIYEAMDVPIPT